MAVLSSFCSDILSKKKSQSQTVFREKLGKALSYEKGKRKMLMKLTIDMQITSSLT